jgi:1-deoxy-D-xylulose-5-phosphate reductoisomerase
MDKTGIVILGSTGSIGKQALEIVREHPDRFNVVALSCNCSWELLAKQIEEFNPDYALLCDESFSGKLDSIKKSDTEILIGSENLSYLAAIEKADVVLNALVGFSGFEPTVAALKANKRVALANKESLVVGGALINDLLESHAGQLIPVDSEHSAIFQCLVGENHTDVEKLIITASGGPFRTWTRKQMEEITVREALDHPNWSMGAKITIDSATMMNKGLEVIEAHWLFDLPLSQIEAVIHPQSIIHSVVTFVDGSSKAQLGPPTMKVPILYALTYPDRINQEVERLDWKQTMKLNFEPMDYKKFPSFKLALNAINEGGNAPAILNAANEIAVQRFLEKEISYIQIPQVIEKCLSKINEPFEKTVQALKAIDTKTRHIALTI